MPGPDEKKSEQFTGRDLRWIIARAATVDAAETERFDDTTIRDALVEAGLSATAVERAISEAAGGAIRRADAARARQRGDGLRWTILGGVLLASGALGIAQGFNVGDLIPLIASAVPFGLGARDLSQGRPTD